MSLPSDVTTATLTFGPYLDASGAPLFAGLVATITPSATVRHLASGAVVVDAPLSVTIGADGTASIALPRTDLTVFDVVGFTYLVRWRTSQLGSPSPGNKRIALPLAVASVVDFDLLVPSPIVAGVLVPIAVAPAGPPGLTGTAIPQTTPSASWSLTHTLGRLPNVAVYVAGELVEADVTATTTAVSVVFPSPMAGVAVLT